MKKIIIGLLSLGIIVATTLYTVKVVKEIKSMANEMNYEGGMDTDWKLSDFLKNKDLKGRGPSQSW
ncbi:hypothetical protein V7128_27740 [Neobacillus vireti]|uniref:hypothetical protein n=1 Tax=Neobacillus vireti TaxID=220686 RepID=UPI002FFEE88E